MIAGTRRLLNQTCNIYTWKTGKIRWLPISDPTKNLKNIFSFHFLAHKITRETQGSCRYFCFPTTEVEAHAVIYLVYFSLGLFTSTSPCLGGHHLSHPSSLPQFTSALSHCFSPQTWYLQHVFSGWTYPEETARDSGGRQILPRGAAELSVFLQGRAHWDENRMSALSTSALQQRQETGLQGFCPLCGWKAWRDASFSSSVHIQALTLNWTWKEI